MDLLEDSGEEEGNNNYGAQGNDLDENLLLNSDDEESGSGRHQYNDQSYLNEEQLLYEGDEDEYGAEETEDVLDLELGDEELETPDASLGDGNLAPLKVRSQYAGSSINALAYHESGNNFQESYAATDDGSERTADSPPPESMAGMNAGGDSDDDEESPRHRSRFLSERKTEDINTKSVPNRAPRPPNSTSAQGNPILSLGDQNPRQVHTQDARRGARGGFAGRGGPRHFNPRGMPNPNMRMQPPSLLGHRPGLLRFPNQNPRMNQIPMMQIPGGFIDFNGPMRRGMKMGPNPRFMPLQMRPGNPGGGGPGPNSLVPGGPSNQNQPQTMNGPQPRRLMGARMQQNRMNRPGPPQQSPNAFGGPPSGPQMPGPGPSMQQRQPGPGQQRQRFPMGGGRFPNQSWNPNMPSNQGNRMPMGGHGPLNGPPEGFNFPGPNGPNGGPMRFHGSFENGPPDMYPGMHSQGGPMARFPGPPGNMHPNDMQMQPGGPAGVNQPMHHPGGFAPHLNPDAQPFFMPRPHPNGMNGLAPPGNYRYPVSHPPQPNPDYDFNHPRGPSPGMDPGMGMLLNPTRVDGHPPHFPPHGSENGDNPFFKTSHPAGSQPQNQSYRPAASYDEARREDDRYGERRSESTYRKESSSHREDSRRYSPDRDRRDDYYDYEYERSRSSHRDRYDDEYSSSRRHDRRSSPGRPTLRRTIENDERGDRRSSRSPEKRLDGRLGPPVPKGRGKDDSHKQDDVIKIIKESQSVMGLDDDYLRKIEEQKEMRERILREKEERRKKHLLGQEDSGDSGNKRDRQESGLNSKASEQRRRTASDEPQTASPRKKTLSETEYSQRSDSPKAGKSIYVNPKAFQGDLSVLSSNLKAINMGVRNAGSIGNSDIKTTSSNATAGGPPSVPVQQLTANSGNQKKRTILRIVRNKKGEIISKRKVIIMPKGSLGESATEALQATK